MDRKQFVRLACGLGASGGVTRLGRPEPPSAEEPRLPFARVQVANLVSLLGAGPSAKPLQARFRGLLRGGPPQLGHRYPAGQSMGVITVTVAEGPCGCPLVDPGRMPALWCNCSVGYPKETFEAVFGRPVQARLLASKLGGAKRCAFEITLG